MKVKNNLKTPTLMFLAFVLTFISVLITYAVIKLYPFGENILLRIDLYHQYAPFHEELRNKILNGESLIYSWEGGLGKELITQISYYTASPFSFLILFFPTKYLSEAMATMIILKIALSSAFCAFYLNKVFKRNDLSVVAFSLFYALMAFTTSYYWNLMWFDAVFLFPLVAYGIEALIKDDNHKPYCISLALVIIINFYIAFIVCVFSVLYYIVILFSNYSWNRDKKLIISRTVKFGISSAIAGGISMILVLPTAIALTKTATSETTFSTLKVYTNIYQLFTNHFFGARPVVLARNEDAPNFYTGVLTIVLLPLYFLNKKFPKKEKWLYAGFIFIVMLCSCVNLFDFLIHGLHYPSNLPHRYSFIYSFVIITLAYKAFDKYKYVKVDHAIAVPIVYTIIILISELLIAPKVKDIEPVLTADEIFLNIVLMIGYISFLYWYVNSKSKNIGLFMIVLVIAAFAETTASSIKGFDYVGTTDRQGYNKYIDDTNEMLDYTRANDDGVSPFYRQEFRRFTAINEGSLYHYKSFSQFSSLAYGATSQAITDLGIAATGNSYRYYDPTPLIDAIFNIKYVMNKDGELAKTDYEFIKSFNSVYLYKNNKYLQPGFMVKKDFENWTTKDSNPFKAQNEFINLSTTVQDQMMIPTEVTDIAAENIKITQDEKDSHTHKYDLTNPDSLDLIPKMTAKVHNDKYQKVFIYVDAANAGRFVYTINGNSEDRELSTGRSLINCGFVDAGTDIDISLKLDRKGQYEKTYRKNGTVKLYAAGLNYETFDKAYDELKQNQYWISEYDDTHVTGTVTAAEDGIMFTSIPYDNGWSVKVDGEKAKILPVAAGGFLGVELPKGEHEVSFSYSAKGLLTGFLISGLSIAAFVFYTRLCSRKSKKTVELEDILKNN